MRSETASTSRSLWVMKMMVRPLSASERRWRTARASPAASAPRSARRGSGSRRRDRAPSGSPPAGAARPAACRRRRADRARARTARLSSPHARSAASRSRRPARSSGSAPRMMLSATVKDGASLKCWCTMPMPLRMASAGPAKLHRLAAQQDLARVRAAAARRGCSSASSCRRRSRRPAHGSRRAGSPWRRRGSPRDRRSSWRCSASPRSRQRSRPSFRLAARRGRVAAARFGFSRRRRPRAASPSAGCPFPSARRQVEKVRHDDLARNDLLPKGLDLGSAPRPE